LHKQAIAAGCRGDDASRRVLRAFASAQTAAV